KDELNKISQVKTFTEKPNLEMAKSFLKSGDFLWNAGIFLWTANSIIEAMKEHLPDLSSLFEEGKDRFNTAEEDAFIENAYTHCTSISIDYGVMEKANNVHVLSSEFGWSDLGTYGSLYEHVDHDKDANAIVGKNIMLYDSKNCIVNVPDGKLVVAQGLDDYIVVESNDVLLICKKEDEQQIKKFVDDVKKNKGEEFV
ncbi:MAG: mannose-1-phosphate guanylyltransferase, partial [Bacteroidia bacterium]|nr:mannose-1-phosphate guanylyltransferase [Bacteroidia bacterium]